MAKKKYYAVKKGNRTGIFYTWDECKQQVDGVSGAEYKSFATEEEAKVYLGSIKGKKEIKSTNGGAKRSEEEPVEAYVDGSYCSETEEFSYGMVILRDGNVYKFSQKVDNRELAGMHNVAGEIKGAEAAMQYAIDNSISQLVIYHDYEGIAKWCTEEWKANKVGTQAYRDFYNSVKDKVKIKFIKVKGHSNNKYNDLADKLAKEALGLMAGDETVNVEEKEQMAKSVYIIRDVEKLNHLLDEIVHGYWPEAECEEITPSGNHQRYTFYVRGKKSILDIYQKTDGQTTLCPTGSNTELAKKVKEEVELHGYRMMSEQKEFSMFIGEE